MQVKKALLQVVDINSIIVEDRFRKDYGDMEELCESIKEKGLIQPLSVEADTLRLLAGGRRYEACKRLDIRKVPVLFRETQGDELDRREVELIENVHRKDFGWQERARLLQEIDRLYKAKHPTGEDKWTQTKTAELVGRSKGGVSMSLALADAMEQFPELAECRTEDDARKAVDKMIEKAIIQEQRVRQTASMENLQKGHKMMLQVADKNYRIGDVFEGMQELKTNGMIHLIECDPPYAIDLDDLKEDDKAKTYNEVPREEYPNFLQHLTKELYRIAHPHSWLVFWFGPTHFTLVKTCLVEAGWNVRDVPAIWIKPSGQTRAPEHNLANCYEPFFICSKGRPVLLKRGRSNIFDFQPVPAAQKYHPTERPVKLIEELIDTFTTPNSVCFVPFLGSGATLRACYLKGVYGFGYDLSDEYKDKFMLAVDADTTKLDQEE